MRTTQTGKPVATFSVATSRKRGDQESTCWHRIIAWERLAETCCQYLQKGKLVLVEGELTQREYVDNSGQNRQVFEVVAGVVRFLEKADQAQAPQGQQYQQRQNQYAQQPQPAHNQYQAPAQQTAFDGSDVPF